MKQTIKSLLSHSGILKPLKAFHKNNLIIFNYHRVKGNQASTNFDESVFGTTAERFRQEMEWLKKETRIISEDELLEMVYKNKKFSEVCSMVTFDDGYRDNFDIAYPILKELNIPAIFFIPTHQMTTRKLGWWDIVAYFIKQTKEEKFVFQNVEYSTNDRPKLIKLLNNQVKKTEANLINHFLNQLSVAVKVPFPDIELQSEELMTWEQVKILCENGMTIGSHSHDHSILSRQDAGTLATQLSKSIHILENEIKRKIRSIAYPVGGYQHFNHVTKSISKAVGFKLGFSYLTGINPTSEIDPFNVKRMSIRPEWVNLELPLAFPEIFLKETPH